MDPVTLALAAVGVAASAAPQVWRRLVEAASTNARVVRFLLRFGVDLRQLPAHERTEQTFEERIGQLATALQASAGTIGEIQREIERRQTLVYKLQQDAERYEELSRLKRTEAEAVAQLVEGKLRQGERRSFWTGFAMNFFFFLLGVAASIVLTNITS